MARFYGIDAANAALPELRELLELLRDHREELVRLRDEAVELQSNVEAAAEKPGTSAGGGGGRAAGRDEAELRRLRLRMQGRIDQMQAAVARIDELGVTLRDIPTGLIDFPALVAGRQVWLCWRLGEDDIAWWHELTAGVAGRQPMSDLH